MLAVKIDEKGHNERPPNYEKERQEDLEKVGFLVGRLELVLINQVSMIMKNLIE